MSSEEEDDGALVIDNDTDDFDDDSEVDLAPEVTITDFSSLELFQEEAETSLPQNFKIEVIGGHVTIQIPSAVLPLQQLIVYGYSSSNILIDIQISFVSTPDFKSRPTITMSNPIHGKNFIGKPRLESVIQKFFSPSFSPKYKYDCYPILFDRNNRPVRNLQYYSVMPNHKADFKLSYISSPLFYFIFECIDTMLSLTTTCSICGKPLPFPVLKPAICNNPTCEFGLRQLSVGNSLIQEIKRDPAAADYVFSAFANAFGSQFVTPPPPAFITQTANQVFSTLPPMAQIAKQYHSDKELINGIGTKAVDLLRYIIFGNRNQFLLLPDSLKFKNINCPNQFMSICATPEAEVEFQKLKSRYGSQLLWHGSHSDRWHAIFHNGLINASGTRLQANGAAYGNGIYFAYDANMSWGYVRSARNVYANSAFPTFACIALCEVAKVPELRDHGNLCTLTNEAACIVRFLFVGNSFSASFSKSNISLPTLQQIQQELLKK